MRRLLCMMVVAVAALVASPAWAGPYLNTSAMLLRESFAAGRWVRANLGDKDLARAAHRMAQARLDVATNMPIPKEVRKAHPHLLLALAAMERAMGAAADGEVSNFVRQLQTSTGEAKTFEAVLKGLGFSLPEMRRSTRTSLRRPPRADLLAIAVRCPETPATAIPGAWYGVVFARAGARSDLACPRARYLPSRTPQ